jgi:hypothetical protein
MRLFACPVINIFAIATLRAVPPAANSIVGALELLVPVAWDWSKAADCALRRSAAIRREY